VNYTRNLGFEADPDYDYLRGLFKNIMQVNSWEYDGDYDWTKTYSATNSSMSGNKIKQPDNLLRQGFGLQKDSLAPQNSGTLEKIKGTLYLNNNVRASNFKHRSNGNQFTYFNKYEQ
jgi:hypothetical protein